MGLSGFAVSPHTGARLETGAAVDALCGVLMPPTRGHDLKHRSALSVQRLRSMPPTQGHMRMLCAKKFTV